MFGYDFLILIATFVIAIIALNKTSTLESRIAQLKLQVGNFADELAKLRQPSPPPPVAEPKKSAAKQKPAVKRRAAAASATPKLVQEPIKPVAQPAITDTARPAPRRDMEQALASRWFVWIGGVAIAIGGLLFVKYAYDNELISPSLQIILGLLLAAVLVAAGEFVRRKSPEGSYVPAALSAAGLVTAFGSIFAAYALYELIAPMLAFAGLAAVGLGALVLSRLQGPLIAALGLIGSYVTPALIPSENPEAWNFFPYLLVILVASFVVLRGRDWWWLAYAAIAGSAAWALLWIWSGLFDPSDTLPIGLFAHALGLISFYGLSRQSTDETAPVTPQLAIGLTGLGAEALLLTALVAKTDHGGLSLLLFFAGVAGAVAIAWQRPRLSLLTVAAAILSFLVLMLWSEVAMHELAMDEQGLWSSVLGPEARRFLNYMLGAGVAFTLIGCFGALLQRHPRNWGLAGGISAVLFVFGAWARVNELLSDGTWALVGAIFAGLLLAATWAGRARHQDTQADLASGLLSAGAALLLLFSLDRLLDGICLTLAIAGLAAAFAAFTGILRVTLQAPIAAAFGSLAALRLFVSRELWEEDRNLPWGPHWPLYGYGIPAILFLVASRALTRVGHLRSAMTLEGLSLGLVISLVALELRVLIGGGITSDEPRLLEMAAHILTWLGAAYGLMHRQQFYSSFIALWGARVLIAVSCAAIVLFSLGALNPVVTQAPLQGNAVFNALLLAYLAPVALLGLIARRLDVLKWERLRPAAGLLALVLAFVYLTLETKRIFQGAVMVAPSMSIEESYAYSAVWLAFALVLFIAGLRLSRQYIRYAGLGVMVLVVLKVFLVDMSNLEGLYRIASFIGLGLCLVGIGWLYQRFVQKPAGNI
ncbi:MAG: DUF2339 domain-containing protein [Rhizobiales bacterium]|nr:DUF2339 domain-containing protein [Hyphomicrobiales bacterium]